MDFAAKKTEAPPATKPEDKGAPERKGQTLRLSVEAWRQLKIMAAEEGVPVHDILVDAVNDAFAKRGKPRIA